MPRVLHILDEAADFQSERAVQQIQYGIGGAFDVALHRLAAGGTFRVVLSGIRGLRAKTGYDMVHAWGPRGLAEAALGAKGPVIYSPPPQATVRTAKWLRAMQQYRQVQVVCTTATQRQMLLGRGVTPGNCHVIRPGVEFAKVRARRDARLRMALGFAEDDIVLLAAGESDVGAGHREAVWAGSILHTLDPRCALLIWGRGREAQRVRIFSQQLGTPREMSVAEQCLGHRWSLKSCCRQRTLCWRRPAARSRRCRLPSPWPRRCRSSRPRRQRYASCWKIGIRRCY